LEDVAQVKELARLYKALGDETRLRLVKLLAQQDGERALCVGALAMCLGVSQPAVSQHLAVLRAAGLVSDERRGYFVHYRLDRSRLRRWQEQMRAVLGEDVARVTAD
jgi:ArsR family transcriptional regulator, arsenate/arsenite/antimonite-responsive transcriptional repressor